MHEISKLLKKKKKTKVRFLGHSMRNAFHHVNVNNNTKFYVDKIKSHTSGKHSHRMVFSSLVIEDKFQYAPFSCTKFLRIT